jgi:membrane fusion protein, multidrug efflux system
MSKDDKMSTFAKFHLHVFAPGEYPMSAPAFVPSLFVSIVLLLLLNACAEVDSENTASSTAAEAVPVRVAQVALLDSDAVLGFASVARARQRANLTFQVGGVIASRTVEIGQQVTQGEELAQLYNPQLLPARDAASARLEQLESDNRQAVRDLERIQQLQELGALPVQDLEQQRSRIESLQAAIANARATLEQAGRLSQESILRAPFNGSIEAILLESGEFTQAGQTVMRMSADDGLEVEAQVPAHMLTGLAPGDMVPVRSSLTGVQIDGIITEIAQASSGNSALYPIIVSIDQPSVRSGDAVEVGIRRLRQPELTIPMAAVMRSADGLAVFRLEDNRVRRVAINVRELVGEYAVLEPGSLTAQDSVVYAGLTRLADGDAVEVLR